MFKTIKAARVVQPHRIRLANYRYEKDKAIGTYAQDETPVLQANFEARQAEDIHHRTADLDMGFRFASVPRVRWLEIQKLGIENDPVAIIRYLTVVNAQEGKNYFTTNKRLL